MIYKASRLIAAEFDSVGIKYGGSIQEIGNASMLAPGYAIENGPNVDVNFISRDDDNDVAVRLFGLLTVSESKVGNVLRAINRCNEQYRYVKLSMDDNNKVDIQYDFPMKLSDDSVGPVAVEIFIRMMKLLDDIYATLMRAIW